MNIPVVVQHRHVHLNQHDRRALFGNQTFAIRQSLGHQGQFVSDACVQISGPNGLFERVRVLGPERDKTQVELSSSDAFAIGLQVPARVSGDLARAGTCKLKGPCGEVEAVYSTIVPARHLHCSPSVAQSLGVSHLDIVGVQILQTKDKIEHVIVRVHPTFALEFHLTKDEASDWWLQTGDHVHLV